jgi:hypothetical protein
LSQFHIEKAFCLVFCAFFVSFQLPHVAFSQEEEKSYDISLVKTADPGKEVRKLEDRKVLTETHVVQKGDHVWQLLRGRGLLEQRNLTEILSMLKRLNASLDNLDMIHPGERIIIPLKIVPIVGPRADSGVSPEEMTSLASLEDVDLRDYTVKRGDNLSRVVAGLYDMPPHTLYSDYLKMVKKLNPSIHDLDTIYPGQSIRLPIYSPEVVRKRIASAGKPDSAGPMDREPPKSEKMREELQTDLISRDLSTIFTDMGEDWVQTGQHFIPLKSGGQIDLKAQAFPVINLRSGRRVIVDLRDGLPDRMARLIESSWGNYGVVRLKAEDDLKAALDKVLSECQYAKIYRKGEALALGGDIPLELTGDWVIVLTEGGSNDTPNVCVITLAGSGQGRTPHEIREFMSRLGIKVIEYPPEEVRAPTPVDGYPTIQSGMNSQALIGTILELLGRPYSTKLEIPVYQSERKDFKLIVKADFFLKKGDQDCIIDLAGLDNDVLSLLRDHGFQVLSIPDDIKPLKLAISVLDFMGVPYKSGSHSFLAARRAASENIKFTLSGIVFHDADGAAILATERGVPEEIALFLSGRKYTLWVLKNA